MKKNLIAGLKLIRWLLPLVLLAEGVSFLGCWMVAGGLGIGRDGQFPFALFRPTGSVGDVNFGSFIIYLASCFLTYVVAGRLALKNRVTHHGLHVWALGLGALLCWLALVSLPLFPLWVFGQQEGAIIFGFLSVLTFLPAQLVKLAGVALGAWWARKSVPGWGQKLCDMSKRDLTDLQLVEKLKGLPNLETLKLAGTPVTDAGMAYLVGLPNLKWLDLRETEVTDTGVLKLRKVLPDCKIRR